MMTRPTEISLQATQKVKKKRMKIKIRLKNTDRNYWARSLQTRQPTEETSRTQTKSNLTSSSTLVSVRTWAKRYSKIRRNERKKKMRLPGRSIRGKRRKRRRRRRPKQSLTRMRRKE